MPLPVLPRPLFSHKPRAQVTESRNESVVSQRRVLYLVQKKKKARKLSSRPFHGRGRVQEVAVNHLKSPVNYIREIPSNCYMAY